MNFFSPDAVCSIIYKRAYVNGTAYMTFKKTTDRLFSRVDHEELAKALEVSVASIRQARLSPDALAHRSPPPDWETAVLRLAEERVKYFQKLVEELRGYSAK
jgi:hypothetical protein